MNNSQIKFLWPVLACLMNMFFSNQSSASHEIPLRKGPSPVVSESAVSPVLNGALLHYSYKLVNVYPHDTGSFTQGLVFHKGYLYEGTGLHGKSRLLKVELNTGNVLQRHALPESFFGEGVTIFGDTIIQLTWRSNTGFVYNKNDFQLLKTFHYPVEGWGITHDGRRLIMSDGTAHLYFLDPKTFKITGKVEVKDIYGPVVMLNELEYIGGYVYANVWRTDRIAIINPKTGRVKGWVNLDGLSRLAGGDRKVKTLNGIAYDARGKRLFVTGKLWPKVYEIELVTSGLQGFD